MSDGMISVDADHWLDERVSCRCMVRQTSFAMRCKWHSALSMVVPYQAGVLYLH